MDKCNNCIYYHQNGYCSFVDTMIKDIKEAKECWFYKDRLTFRTHKEYQDDYVKSDFDDDYVEDNYDDDNE